MKTLIILATLFVSLFQLYGDASDSPEERCPKVMTLSRSSTSLTKTKCGFAFCTPIGQAPKYYLNFVEDDIYDRNDGTISYHLKWHFSGSYDPTTCESEGTTTAEASYTELGETHNSTYENGVWTDQAVADSASAAVANMCDVLQDACDETSISYSDIQQDENGIGHTCVISEKADGEAEYTTELLHDNLSADIDAHPYSDWSPGMPSSSFTVSEGQSTGAGYKSQYKFRVYNAPPGSSYRLTYRPVTVNADGTTTPGAPQVITLTANGEDYFESEVFTLDIPDWNPGQPESELIDGGVTQTIEVISFEPYIPPLDKFVLCHSCYFGGGFTFPLISRSPVEYDGGIDISIDLGRASMGEHAGFLFASFVRPNVAAFSAFGLQISGTRSDVEQIKTAGYLRQVKTPLILADIITNQYSYEIRLYPLSSVGSQKVDGLWPILASQTPYETHRLENPDNSLQLINRFRYTVTRGSSTYVYDYEYFPANTKWLLTMPGNLSEVEVSEVFDPSTSTRNVTKIIRKPGEPTAYKEIKKYASYDWGAPLVEYVVGPDESSPKKTTFTWGLGVIDGITTPLDTVVYPNGNWQHFVYDNAGRLTKQINCVGNSAPNSEEALNKATYYDYTPIIDSGDIGGQSYVARTEIDYYQGVEVGRRYRVVKDDERLDIVCQTPGASWDAADNLTTDRKYVPPNSGPFSRYLLSVTQPDGTMAAYQYPASTNAPMYFTNLIGEALGTNVINGTKTVTQRGAAGEPLSEVQTDLPSNIIVSSQTYGNFDAFRRPQQITQLDGTSEQFSYACCGLESTTDRDGIVTLSSYDAMGRKNAETRLNITTTNILDAAGNILVTRRIGSDNSTITLRSAAYDTAGRTKFETNALGGVTQYSENTSGGPLVRTITYPNSGTRIETYFRDGTLQRVTGTASYPVEYVYGLVTDPASPDVNALFTKEVRLAANLTWTSEVTTNFIDFAGRPYKTTYPAATAPYPFEQVYFDFKGQPWKTVDADGVATLLQYNTRGEIEYLATDLNRNNSIDFAGTDRIARVYRQTLFNSATGENVRRAQLYAWGTDGIDSGALLRTRETSTDGLRSWDTIWNGSSGITTKSQTVYTAGSNRSITTTFPDNSTELQQFLNGRLTSITSKDSSGAQIGKTSYSYDPHGRTSAITDARNGATTLAYNAADQISSATTPSPGPGMLPQTTTWTYSNIGLLINTLFADFTATTNEYYLTGDLQRTSGSRTYPVEYAYDPRGRLKTMTTWTNFAAGSGAAITTWNYDSRGFFSGKLDANNKGPTYTYSPGGRLKTRTWARGVTTTYNYNNAGDLSTVAYSDTTPGETYTYDRLGQSKTVLKNGRTTTFDYNGAGEVLKETYTGGTWAGLMVTNNYDSLLRRASVIVAGLAATLNAYTYDTASRLASVGDGTSSANYSYLANSPLVNQITYKQGTTTRLTTTKNYDLLDRLKDITSLPSASTELPIAYAFAYNDANQHTRQTMPDASVWSYGYDSLGQLKSGKKSWNDGAPVPGQQFEYTFDDIGNRRLSREGGDQTGNPSALRTTGYAPNNLNQISNRTVPPKADIIGLANPTATISVNSDSTGVYRRGEYFRKELTLASYSYPTIPVATSGGTNNSSASGKLFIPPATENYAYDFDGNLLSDGRWTYGWDAENQLVAMQTLSGAPSGSARRVEFEYDHVGRRIQKRSYIGTTNILTSSTKYLYDDFNLLAELNESGNTLLRSYIWGPDITGLVRGTGGVGGLIAVTDSAQGTHFATSDGQGNVTALLKATDGTRTAAYEYDPFGQSIRKTGVTSDLNPFRYSSRFTDSETDLLYYGFRLYNPNTGRWLNRDPIEEWGGLNLYGFVDNSPLDYVDLFGLTIGDFWDPETLRCRGEGFLRGLEDQVLGGLQDLWESATTPPLQRMQDAMDTAADLAINGPDYLHDTINDFAERYMESKEGCGDPCDYLKMEGSAFSYLTTALAPLGPAAEARIAGQLGKEGELLNEARQAVQGGMKIRIHPRAGELGGVFISGVKVPKGGTYRLKDEAGMVMKTGRSKDLARREKQLARKYPDLKFEVHKRTDRYEQQRGWEESIYNEQNPPAPLDKIRPIDPKNANADTYRKSIQGL
jgi:RHS repeat-associated protein